MLFFDKSSKVLRIIATVMIVAAFAVSDILLFAGAFSIRYIGWFGVAMIVGVVPVLLSTWFSSLMLIHLANTADSAAEAAEYARMTYELQAQQALEAKQEVSEEQAVAAD